MAKEVLPRWLRNRSDSGGRRGEAELPRWMTAVRASRDRLQSIPPHPPFPQIEQLVGKENYYKYLAFQNNQADSNPFPSSDAAENPDVFTGMTHDQVKEVTNKYIAAMGQRGEYEIENNKIHSSRIDFNRFPKENPAQNRNLGHKLHLNVTIDHAREVSDYLIRQGYSHKFLKVGGEIDSGKIFTLYIGSASLAFKLAAEISRDLNGKLARPIDRLETEYAPNVVGRFNVDENFSLFARYGMPKVRGMSPLKRYAERRMPWSRPLMSEKAAFEDSFKALAYQYGDYFYGKTS